MAAGTAILCGLTLEYGRPQAETRKFQAMQAVSYYSANIGSFLLGGLSLRPPSTKPGLSGRLSHSGHSLRCNSSLVLAITERRENKCQTIATDSASEAGSNSV